MKNIKNFIFIIMSFIMFLTNHTTTFASDIQANGTNRIIYNNGYSFEIKETVDKNNNIIRTYQNNKNELMSLSNDYSVTRSLLVSLGMDKDYVNELTMDTLKEFSEGEQIVVTTSYSKIDKNNNKTYLDEETALKESAILKEQQHIIKMNNAFEKENYADYSDIFKDSYMKLTYAVTYKSNGSYLYSVDSTWLTMPFFRGYDSIGSCAMNGTVTNSTRSGYYKYDATYINNGTGGTVTYDKNKKVNITKFKNAIKGNWYGSVGIFNLPNDINNSYATTFYENIRAHYQYQGHVTSPSEARWFNTVASYDHATIAITIDTPSIGIDLNGEVSASIGLAITGSKDTRSVELEIHYIP